MAERVSLFPSPIAHRPSPIIPLHLLYKVPIRIRALIRFHMAAGGRVALRANAVVAAIFVFIFGSAPDGLATLRALVLGTVSSARGWAVLAMFAGLPLAPHQRRAAARVTLDSRAGCAASPRRAATNRLAAIVALSATQLVSVAWTAFAAVLTLAVYHAPLSVPKLLAIPVIIASVAAFVVFTADRNLRRREPSRIGVWRWLRNTQFGFLHWIRFSWAALPGAAVFGSLILPTIFIAFAYMILLHNPDLPPAFAHRTVRMSGSLAVGALAASLSNALLRLRPAWAWSRSLPWSSLQRVIADAIAVGAPVCVAAATLLPLDGWNALAVLATVPAIAATSANALRAGATRQTGAAGEVVIVATIAGTLIALSPLLAIIPLFASPAIIHRAAQRDRRTISSRFAELQHDAGADAAWLGAR